MPAPRNTIPLPSSYRPTRSLVIMRTYQLPGTLRTWTPPLWSTRSSTSARRSFVSTASNSSRTLSGSWNSGWSSRASRVAITRPTSVSTTAGPTAAPALRARSRSHSAWVRSAEDEALLRRALDAEKPAHTVYQLCLVEPRLVVGTSSTVGIDTVVGGVPEIRLRCRGDTDAPPGRPPRGRLGYDTVLAAAPGRRPRLADGVRVGIDTVLS